MDTFLDDGTARTAGETWSLNGGNFTIRTDTRVHIGAPAGFTGSLGNINTPTNYIAGTLVEGRNVREVWFDTGSGNVPAIGTTISQGGVEGYLLGVWPDLLSLPVVPGNAMPASGFIKFREVEGGNFAAGALSGIGANATGADTTSWIEIVSRETVAHNVPRIAFFRTRGDWYYSKDLTSGSANQIIQFPAMGSAGTHVPAVWIETAPGSDNYEIFPSLSSTFFLDANLGTDVRSKFVNTIGNAQIRIGHDGTTATGYVPVANCRIRIPNILGRSVVSTNDALNVVPNITLSTRPEFFTNGGGNIDLEYFMADWWFNFVTAYSVKLNYVAWFESINFTIPATPFEINNSCSSAYTLLLGSTYSLTITTGGAGGTIKNSKFYRGGDLANQHVCIINTGSNITIEDCHFGNVSYGRQSSVAAIVSTQVTDSVYKNLNILQSYLVSNAASRNLSFSNIDYCDRIKGSTNATTPFVFFVATNCRDISFDGLTFGFGGVVTDFVNPYTGIFNCIGVDNLKIRNAGTRTAPLLCENLTNASGYIFTCAGLSYGHEYKRLYLNITRTSPFFDGNAAGTYNLVMESVHGTVGAPVARAKNAIMRGYRATDAGIGVVSNMLDTFAHDMFTSDIDGIIWFHFNELSSINAQYTTLSLAAKGGFNSNAQILLPSLGDYLIYELPYFALGHTAFKNTDPTITTTYNLTQFNNTFTLEYDVDTGLGFSGTYKALNGTNLSGETLDPSIGVKLKIKLTAILDNNSFPAANNGIRIFTETTLAAQTNYLYPLDYSTITITNLRANSRVQFYDVTNDLELYNAEVAGTETSYSAPYVLDYTVRIRVMYATTTTADEFIEFTGLVEVTGFERSVLPAVDPVYLENAINGFAVTGIEIDDDNLLVKMDDGEYTWGQIYNYESAWLYSEAGIRKLGRFMRPIDAFNYIITDFKFKNISVPSLPVSITNGWGRDSVTLKTIDLIDTTGGTIFSNPDLVIPYESRSPLTPEESLSLANINTISERIDGLIEDSGGDRFTAKALEEGGGGITAADVWSETLAANNSPGTFGYFVQKLLSVAKFLGLK